MLEKLKIYENYIFDLDNTLIDENLYLFAGYRDIANYYGVSNDLSKKMYEYLKEQFIKNGRKDLFNNFLKEFNLSDINMGELLSILRNTKVEGGLNINPNLKSIITELCSTFKPYYIITNGNIEQQMNKVKQINWKDCCQPDRIVFANEFKPKPATNSFDYLNSEIGFINPVYIGDSDSDRQFAINSGIDFIHVSEFMPE